ncbi:hypothetical protein BGY98DRAFT_155323 [Russula aff. rugulosa BPL654]|nr:hypothetical protein BGY98DRAFT_155323 [Russula aff. rugulosa BPL654]
MSSATDLESGQGARAAAPHTEVAGNDSVLPVHEAQPVVSQAETQDETSSPTCCCIPSASGVSRPFTSVRSRSNIDHPQRNVSDQSTQTGQGSSRAAETQIHPASEQIPEEPRMIGDFDGSSNALWTLFRDEAKSHDDAKIVTLKDDMESSLIFAGLFSASLTAFVVDSNKT